jgi:hypothetical protein
MAEVAVLEGISADGVRETFIRSSSLLLPFRVFVLGIYGNCLLWKEEM